MMYLLSSLGEYYLSRSGNGITRVRAEARLFRTRQEAVNFRVSMPSWLRQRPWDIEGPVEGLTYRPEGAK